MGMWMWMGMLMVVSDSTAEHEAVLKVQRFVVCTFILPMRVE